MRTAAWNAGTGCSGKIWLKDQIGVNRLSIDKLGCLLYESTLKKLLRSLLLPKYQDLIRFRSTHWARSIIKAFAKQLHDNLLRLRKVTLDPASAMMPMAALISDIFGAQKIDLPRNVNGTESHAPGRA